MGTAFVDVELAEAEVAVEEGLMTGGGCAVVFELPVEGVLVELLLLLFLI